MLRLYLDDVRPTPDGFDLRAFTAKDAIGLLQLYPVMFISFDHDLGPTSAGTGYDVAKWIEEQAHTNPEFVMPEFTIHSANPVGRNNIIGAMYSALRARETSKCDHVWMEDHDRWYCGKCFASQPVTS